MYSGDNALTGYDNHSYKELLEKTSGTSFDDIYNDLIEGNLDFINYLDIAFKEFGWKVIKKTSSKATNKFGLKGVWLNNGFNVSLVAEGSSGDISGLIPGDKIHSVNGYKLNNDLDQWLKYFNDDEIVLSLERQGVLKRLILLKFNEIQLYIYSVEKI